MSLDTVGLVELNEAAALQTRVDRKYLVPLAALVSFEDWASESARVLEIDGLTRFAYRSVYFDTPDLICYRDAARGRPRRYKVRTRSYLDSGVTMLEVKERGQRGDAANSSTVKHRMGYDQPARLDPYARSFVASFAGQHLDPAALTPVLTTYYHRETLLIGSDNTRVTIDRSLRWEQAATGYKTKDYAIVETKTRGKAGIVDRWFWQHGLRPVKVSKYGTGLASLTPGLAANKWDRVLRSYFADSPRFSQTANP